MDGVEVRNMDRREFIRNAALAGIALSQSGCALQAVTRLPKAVEANLALEKKALAILTNWAPRGGWFDLEVIEAIASSRIPLPTEWIKRVEAHPEMFSNDELRARWLAAKVLHGVADVDCLDGENINVRQSAAWRLVSFRPGYPSDKIRQYLVADRRSECWPTSVLLEKDRLVREEFIDWVVHGKPLTAQWAAVSFLDPIPPEEILPRVLPAFASLDPQVQIVVLRSFFNWPASQYDGEFWKLIAQVPDPSEIVGLEHFSNCAGDTARRCGLYGDIIQFSRTHVAAIMAAERCLEMSHGEIPDNLRLVAERMDALLDLPDHVRPHSLCPRWLLKKGNSFGPSILRSPRLIRAQVMAHRA